MVAARGTADPRAVRHRFDTRAYRTHHAAGTRPDVASGCTNPLAALCTEHPCAAPSCADTVAARCSAHACAVRHWLDTRTYRTHNAAGTRPDVVSGCTNPLAARCTEHPCAVPSCVDMVAACGSAHACAVRHWLDTRTYRTHHAAGTRPDVVSGCTNPLAALCT
eukprot:gene6809-5992_t